MNIRVKIHGNPEEKDIESVMKFVRENNNKISEKDKQEFPLLIAEMKKLFAPIDIGSLGKHLKKVSNNSEAKKAVKSFIDSKIADKNEKLNIEDFKLLSDFLLLIRTDLLREKGGEPRLVLLDLSLAVENILFKELSKWQTKTLKKILRRTTILLNH